MAEQKIPLETEDEKEVIEVIDNVKEFDGFKIFDMYDVSEIKIEDVALKPYINLSGKLLIKNQGRNTEKFAKAKINILERLSNRLSVSGHIGKKHKRITGWSSGKYNKNMKAIINVMNLIAKKTDKNPVQVLVTAIENGSPRDEITIIEHGGARYPQSVDASPLRRVDLALRWMVQGAYGKSFGKKRKIVETLADEIIKASEGNMESFALAKKNDAEKQADSAR